MLEGIEVKSKVREPKRLTSYNEQLPARAQTFPKLMADTEATKLQIQTTIVAFTTPGKSYSKVGFQKGTRRAHVEASTAAIGPGLIAIMSIKIEMTKTAKKKNLGWERSGLDQRASNI